MPSGAAVADWISAVAGLIAAIATVVPMAVAAYKKTGEKVYEQQARYC
jgi:hypothetical protein